MKKTGKLVAWLLVLALLLQICPGSLSGSGEALAADDKIVVACVGDSMTYGYTTSNPAQQSYPARLQVMLGDAYEVKNFGVNSMTMISDVADSYIKTTAYQQSISCNPDIVILMLGSNDVKQKYWNKEKYAADAKKMMETYENLPSSPKVFYATTPASARFANDDIRMQTIDEELIPLQRQLAQENQWNLIDIYAKSKGKYALYHADGIHFSVQGYFYEAECMYEGIMGKPLAEESLPLRSIYSPTQETGTEAEHAIDNDYATLWHSQYTPSASPREEHYAVIELEKRSMVDGVEYLPRLDNSVNGVITEYEIQVSNDGGKNYTSVSEGTWDETKIWKHAEFAPVAATHIKLISKNSSSQNNNDLTSAVEIRVTGDTYTAADVQAARAELQKDYENEVALKRNKADYREASWNALQEEMARVKDTLDDAASSLEALNKRAEAFRQAILDLKEIPKTALDPLKAMDALYYIAEDGTLLPYRIYIPADYDERKEYPLLLFLHGAGERGYNNSSQLETSVDSGFFLRVLGPEREQYPAIIVAPQCPEGQQWVDTPWANGSYTLSEVPQSNESKAVVELLDYLMEKYSIDEGRQYLAGFSMGAFGIWDLVMRDPDRYAAIAAFAGAADPSMAEAIKDVPIWAFHGQSDTVVPFEKSTKVMIEALRAAGGTPRYTEYTAEQVGGNGHIIRFAYYEPELLSWMFSQDKTPTDKSRLEALIETIHGLDLEPYTQESVNALQEVLKEAESLLEETGVTQEEVDAAVVKLDQAADALLFQKLPFEDVKEDFWGFEAIRYVYSRGLMKGYSSGNEFGFNNGITRSDFAVTIWRMYCLEHKIEVTDANKNGPEGELTEDPFPDVAKKQYAARAIAWAAKQGIVTGATSGEKKGYFDPDRVINRQEVAIMLYRYEKAFHGEEMIEVDSKVLEAFPDYEKAYKPEEMSWAVQMGIIQGTKNMQTQEMMLEPYGTAVRAQSAAMFQRYLEKKL